MKKEIVSLRGGKHTTVERGGLDRLRSRESLPWYTSNHFLLTVPGRSDPPFLDLSLIQEENGKFVRNSKLRNASSCLVPYLVFSDGELNVSLIGN
jgi:hypothetical protein